MSSDAKQHITSPRPAPIPLPVHRPAPLSLPTEYHRLRTEQPVARLAFPDGPPGWLVTRYDDVRACLADPRLSSKNPHRYAHLRSGLATPTRADPSRSAELLTSDPPEHTRFRSLVVRQFTTRRMKQLTPRIQAIVDDHLDALASAPRPADLIQTVALPVPSLVISELLGVPFADRDFYYRLTRQLLSLSRTREQLRDDKAEMKVYLLSLVKARREEPADDVLGGLVQAQANGTPITDDEIATLGQLLLIAGHETTANAIGLAVLLLLQPPRLWDKLVQRPDLIDGYIEETLRYATVLQFGLLRVAREPLAIGGQAIEAGERVVLHVPSANRDAALFTNPDQLDPQRPNADRHLSFGHGPHHCLGEQLARIELRTVLTTLLRRFPDLRLAAASEEIRHHHDRLVHGVTELPVDFGEVPCH
ncbi:cytochrome P450 [Streptomyces omiyaensis]|uniref:cytochrome P450 n=1 Tax=Streptomyces omiyaensis TaxID=68247 RepID=UPI0036F74106